MTTATTNGGRQTFDERGQRARPLQQQLLRHHPSIALQAGQPAVLDVVDFNERIIRGYEGGLGERDLPSTSHAARSSRRHRHLRDFSNISPEIPRHRRDCTTEWTRHRVPEAPPSSQVLSETEFPGRSCRPSPRPTGRC